MLLKFIPTIFLIISMIACNSPSNKKEMVKEEKQMINKEETSSDTTVQKGPGVYFVNLQNDNNVQSPLFIKMGVKGMMVEPSGKIIEGKGHHHIIIDGTYIEEGKMIPEDETHIHFGDGQTTETLTLTPGKHILTLQFGNGVHQSYGKDWSKTITVHVKKSS